ncbi:MULTISPECIES: flagellar hook protein FlgE [Xanthomonas]|uniref:Flagellar hook protein FlgE n=1 Tax=Xanthomonas sacchari TaxID=56458 RepID=A0ABT3DW28_9XANT|nr:MULTISPECIES: flagellar hook protein FlgE [Xanthomonas]KAA8918699.1 flagellar hook protein FlgE [Xanthomonas sontii]KAB7775737.1 flagellar hook protein FlgE [Xanthomonas sp. LMG 12459]MCW0372087.1 Flagellar hook protein FlgE [Xanthomonas sacchari]MCW0379922.1 Flagellar hook protein FlgE [Xanthomonas sacchari]MCW0399714.1 Flagellar hook protein FlgE [Xanthomonas sacchari]
MGFNTSLSGLRAANTDLNVTANNIANANTTGFKGSRAEFADQFTLNGYGLARNAVGSGVRVSNVAQQFSQGTIDPTGRSLDLAISGSGFFTLSNNGARVYSRAGNFQTDANGYVVNPQGARLQVFPPASNGNGFAAGTLTDLQLLTTDSPPKQTSTVNLTFTLPGNTQPPTVTTFDPNDANSYNNSSGGTTVYDSLGVAHVQTSYFVKTSTPNQWTVYNYVDGVAAGGASTLQFSNSGALVSPADGKIPLGSFTPATGAGTLSLTLNVFGSTQYGEAFALRGATQDGYASGKLNSISIDEKGIVYARYSNNADKALGQIAVTNFVNPQGLSSLGDNAWAESSASGIARTGSPATSDFGSVQSGALESSTVDLTEQLVNMIVAQRNFQANSQVISTQDQVTQTIINMR